jgi:hypothetical protein
VSDDSAPAVAPPSKQQPSAHVNATSGNNAPTPPDTDATSDWQSGPLFIEDSTEGTIDYNDLVDTPGITNITPGNPKLLVI